MYYLRRNNNLVALLLFILKNDLGLGRLMFYLWSPFPSVSTAH